MISIWSRPASTSTTWPANTASRHRPGQRTLTQHHHGQPRLPLEQYLPLQQSQLDIPVGDLSGRLHRGGGAPPRSFLTAVCPLANPLRPSGLCLPGHPCPGFAALAMWMLAVAVEIMTGPVNGGVTRRG